MITGSVSPFLFPFSRPANIRVPFCFVSSPLSESLEQVTTFSENFNSIELQKQMVRLLLCVAIDSKDGHGLKL